jgi:spore coat protein CotH
MSYFFFPESLLYNSLALEVLLGHGDGYMGSAHNYMMYQDPAQGGRLVWLSSDLDQTIGNTLKATRTCHSPFECLDRYGVFDQTVKRPLVHQLLKVPSFQQQFQRIFGDFHHALFKSNALTQHIISLQNLIEQEVQWDQKLDEYRKDYFASNRSIYDFQVQQKVLQLPLGQDFMDRILSNSIGFKQAIEGPIDQHPSIMPLFSWLTETTEYLSDYVSDFK